MQSSILKRYFGRELTIAFLAASLWPLTANAVTAKYCLPKEQNIRLVRATIWSFLFRGDSLRTVRDNAGDRTCVEISVSPEKERMISNVVRDRHPGVEILTENVEQAAPKKRTANIAESCRFVLDDGSGRMKRVYVKNNEWEETKLRGCSIWLQCRRQDRGIELGVSFVGSDLSAQKNRVRSNKGWTLTTESCLMKRGIKTLKIRSIKGG